MTAIANNNNVVNHIDDPQDIEDTKPALWCRSVKDGSNLPHQRYLFYLHWFYLQIPYNCSLTHNMFI